MKGELPLERQAVQVKSTTATGRRLFIRTGSSWICTDLPLDHRKITSWRPAGTNADGRVTPNRNLRSEHRPV